jgi:hypothetical protein
MLAAETGTRANIIEATEMIERVLHARHLLD